MYGSKINCLQNPTDIKDLAELRIYFCVSKYVFKLSSVKNFCKIKHCLFKVDEDVFPRIYFSPPINNNPYGEFVVILEFSKNNSEFFKAL